MMTKIIKVKKPSCKGKEFDCTMKIRCNPSEEKEAKHERYLAECWWTVSHRLKKNTIVDGKSANHQYLYIIAQSNL